MTWFGRQLEQIDVGANTTDTTADDKTINFTYGADGLRGTKTVTIGENTVTSEYVYANGLLAYEKRGNIELYFFYDGLGNLAAVRYYRDATSADYSQYYAITNSMGDVMGFVDGNGTIIATYEYDAWGNVIGVYRASQNDEGKYIYTLMDEEENKTHIAFVNPIRYRGYYLDSETGYYYLQSRYYNPAVGRFLNIDDPVVLKESPMVLTDKNLFSYCDNNPVTRTDDDGEFWETAFDIVSLSLSIVDVAKNPSDPWAWAGLVGDAVDLIPFVTGAGEIVKSIKIAKKAAETIDTLHDAGNGIEIATETISTTKKLHRPYIRKSTREAVESAAAKLPDGRFLDANTGLPINGKYDFGHKYGHEFWRERDAAMAKGWSQKQFNDYMNNPLFYQIEDPISNRSHRFEMR